ncbi:hypothetical protein RUND412_003640 [Rhizina undulata]
MRRTQKVLAFDLYGTILDISSVALELKTHFPEADQSLADDIVVEWRKYQLEYTWRLNSMETYKPFTEVTRLSLLHALHQYNTTLPETTIDEILTAYNSLHPFPDVIPLFASLSDSSIRSLIFSNGTASMITSSLSSPHFPRDSFTLPFVAVDDIKRYKPASEVYHYLAERLEKREEDYCHIYLVSGNPFDIVGAGNVGLRTIWVDRDGKGWGDGLGEPEHIVSGLEEVVAIVEKAAAEDSL